MPSVRKPVKCRFTDSNLTIRKGCFIQMSKKTIQGTIVLSLLVMVKGSPEWLAGLMEPNNIIEAMEH